MDPHEWLRGAIAFITFGGGLLVFGHALAAMILLLRRHGREKARLMVSRGAIWGLNVLLAATLLETVVVGQWHQLGMLAVFVALRTLLKWTFAREYARWSEG